MVFFSHPFGHFPCLVGLQEEGRAAQGAADHAQGASGVTRFPRTATPMGPREDECSWLMNNNGYG